MFDQVVIRRHESGGEIVDPGLLAESLLYYDNVHLLMSGAILRSLLRTIGPDTILALVEQKRLSATWLTDNLGMVTNTVGPISYHAFSAFTFAKRKDGSRVHTKDEVVKCFDDELGVSGSNRKKARRFLQNLEFRAQVPTVTRPDGKTINAQSDGITDLAGRDVEDPNYLRFLIEEGLRAEVPEFALPAGWDFELFKTAEGYVHSTNLNFAKINELYHQRVSAKINSIAPTSLLIKALNARADLYFATDYMSEFVTDRTSSNLIRNRMGEILRRHDKSMATIEAFQDVNLKNGRAVREAINSGERGFDDFLRLLDKAARFKPWIKGMNPDANLLEEYQRAIVTDSWFETLPAKIARFVVFSLSGVGLGHLFPSGIGEVSGVALGAADAFLLSRIFKGWKPNQFVEGPLTEFVSK